MKFEIAVMISLQFYKKLWRIKFSISLIFITDERIAYRGGGTLCIILYNRKGNVSLVSWFTFTLRFLQDISKQFQVSLWFRNFILLGNNSKYRKYHHLLHPPPSAAVCCRQRVGSKWFTNLRSNYCWDHRPTCCPLISLWLTLSVSGRLATVSVKEGGVTPFLMAARLIRNCFSRRRCLMQEGETGKM